MVVVDLFLHERFHVVVFVCDQADRFGSLRIVFVPLTITGGSLDLRDESFVGRGFVAAQIEGTVIIA